MITDEDIRIQLGSTGPFKHFTSANAHPALHALDVDQGLLNDARVELIRASRAYFDQDRANELRAWTEVDRARHRLLFELFSRAETDFFQRLNSIQATERELKKPDKGPFVDAVGQKSQLKLLVEGGLHEVDQFLSSVERYVAFLVSKGVHLPKAELVPAKVDAEIKRLQDIITNMQKEAAPHIAALRGAANVNHFSEEAKRLKTEARNWLYGVFGSMGVGVVLASVSMLMTDTVDLKWFAIRLPFAATFVLLEWLLLNQYGQAKKLLRDYRAKTVVAQEFAALDAFAREGGAVHAAIGVERLKLLHGITVDLAVPEPSKDAVAAIGAIRDALKEIPKP